MEEAFTAPAALRAKLAFVAVAVLRVDSSRFGRKKLVETHTSRLDYDQTSLNLLS
jgi:hypothetical protein